MNRKNLIKVLAYILAFILTGVMWYYFITSYLKAIDNANNVKYINAIEHKDSLIRESSVIKLDSIHNIITAQEERIIKLEIEINTLHETNTKLEKYYYSISVDMPDY